MSECSTTPVGLLGLNIQKSISIFNFNCKFLKIKNFEIVNCLHNCGKHKVSDIFSVFNLILKWGLHCAAVALEASFSLSGNDICIEMHCRACHRSCA